MLRHAYLARVNIFVAIPSLALFTRRNCLILLLSGIALHANEGLSKMAPVFHPKCNHSFPALELQFVPVSLIVSLLGWGRYWALRSVSLYPHTNLFAAYTYNTRIASLSLRVEPRSCTSRNAISFLESSGNTSDLNALQQRIAKGRQRKCHLTKKKY